MKNLDLIEQELQSVLHPGNGTVERQEKAVDWCEAHATELLTKVRETVANPEARNRVLTALPYLRHAVQEAKAEGLVKLGVLALQEDGSGRIVMQFDSEDFFKDLESALGAPPQTAEDDAKAQALKFTHESGLQGQATNEPL